MERPVTATAVEPVPYDPLSYLRANAAARGDALALHDDGEELSFDALLRAVLSLAADLRGRGVEPGDVVAVALAERLAANGPLAVQASKRVARATLADGEAAGWQLNGGLAAAVTGSDDAAEGARAASEKREPAWSGR